MASRSSELTLVRLPDSVALHARPAGALVRAAAAFGATIEVRANGRQANAKSILEILGLGADGGTELAISASGDDAAVAVAQLAQLVTGLS
ncbi:MAG: HPr family phosphocarrier protein [Actinomycetota bacterium]|nr:HPr family phosphocarrier protein [Actinomycetota bacterium]